MFRRGTEHGRHETPNPAHYRETDHRVGDERPCRITSGSGSRSVVTTCRTGTEGPLPAQGISGRGGRGGAGQTPRTCREKSAERRDPRQEPALPQTRRPGGSRNSKPASAPTYARSVPFVSRFTRPTTTRLTCSPPRNDYASRVSSSSGRGPKSKMSSSGLRRFGFLPGLGAGRGS